MVRPHKHVYDGIIIFYMVKEQIEHSYDTNIARFSTDSVYNYKFVRIEYDPLPQTPTKLYAEIDRIRKKENWPIVSWSTFQKYLKILRKKGILIKYPKAKRRYNTTLYRLADYRLFLCLLYLFNHQRFRYHGKIGGRPYASLLIQKLMIATLRIVRIRPTRLRFQRIFLPLMF